MYNLYSKHIVIETFLLSRSVEKYTNCFNYFIFCYKSVSNSNVWPAASCTHHLIVLSGWTHLGLAGHADAAILTLLGVKGTLSANLT